MSLEWNHACSVSGTGPGTGLERPQNLLRAQSLQVSEQEPGPSSLCLSQWHQKW